MNFIRSITFNIAFYGLTTFCCFALLWSLVLPQRWAVSTILLYFKSVALIEKYILGLDYKLEGTENIPTEGNYLVAMKHHSAYETMKVPLIFHDPAIILKRELMWIPLWGWYAAKMRLIPVNRKAKGKAIQSLIDGAKKILAEQPWRPIVIFPQGTRVEVGVPVSEKPYKSGIIRLYEELNLPIVPVALNSGVFWGRKSFTKHAGTVTFRILPPIPAGLPTDEVMERMKQQIETHSDELVEQGKEEIKSQKTTAFLTFLLSFTLLAFLWSGLWFWGAQNMQSRIDDALISLEKSQGTTVTYQSKTISGYPGPIQVHLNSIDLKTRLGSTAHIPSLSITLAPIPGSNLILSVPQGVRSETILNLGNGKSLNSLHMNIGGLIRWPGQDLTEINIISAEAIADDLLIHSTGRLQANADRVFQGQISHKVDGAINHITAIIQNGNINKTVGIMALNWLKQHQDADNPSIVNIRTSVRDNQVYIGPFRVAKIDF